MAGTGAVESAAEVTPTDFYIERGNVMSVPMPPVVVLIVCKVLFVGEPDDNAKFTGWRDTEWDLAQGMMHCRRSEIQRYDAAADEGPSRGDGPAAALPFTQAACNRAGVMQGAQFDADHRDKPWRVWRFACPVPMMNTETGEIVGWQLPDCGHHAVICESDSVI
jgi:hypothetical protein